MVCCPVTIWGVKKYVQLCLEQDYTDIVDHANDSLRIWQAAKAEAHKSASLYQLEINHLASANQQLRECVARTVTLPDGYVVVPKEPSANLVDHGHQVFLCHFNEGGQSGGRSLYFAYKAMIEAVQEKGK